MGRKSSAKGNPPTQTPPAGPRSKTPVVVAGLIVLALAAGALTYFTGPSAEEQQAEAYQTPDRGPIAADLKPHSQDNLPPLQFPAYQTPRSPEVVRAAYKFAAEHPEILSYVPCFCGCERSGHRGNEDCFVKTRDVNGDVVQWEDHGMECAVCLDVATRSLQLHTAGKSVAEIRETIDKEFGPLATTHTPTPAAPHHH
jgi:hypothetical protein